MSELAEDIRDLVESGISPVTADEVWARIDHRGGQRPGSTGRVLIGAAIGVTVLAIALIAALVLAPSGSPGGPTSAAAAELHLLASRAADVPALTPGQYFYSEIETQTNDISYTLANGATIHEYLQGTQQAWVDAEGRGRMVITTDPTPQFFTPADRAAWVAAGSPPAAVPPNELSQEVSVTPTWAGGLSATPLFQVAKLPTDPTALERVLASGRYSGQVTHSPICSSSDCAVVASAAALLQGPDVGMTPALRSALFDVLSHVPGVRDLGMVTDKGGQTGIGLAFTHTRPAQTLTIYCATGGVPAHINGNGIYVPVVPANDGPPHSFPEPAATTSLEFIIDPDTTSVIGTQEVTTPDMYLMPNVCFGQPGYGGKPQLSYVAPAWASVLSEGVVDSDSSTPAAGR